jgi:hypothetical protein
LAGVAGGGPAEHFAGLRIQRQRAVTVVCKPVTLGAARGKRQYRIEPVECLIRRLFIHAEHCRVLRRLSIRNPDRRWPGNARSDAVSGPLFPHAVHHIFADAQMGREFAATPVRRSIGWLFPGGGQNRARKAGVRTLGGWPG